ncbi:hypothetical protein QA640_12270 [Bradyrhizobium sp. CB82]|uniref:hypothetical protein n=1 Tax=Bradyrhizobium sp. CB82 TaxID=3039159 RepID=UPI0024B16EE1|nr:hypothetical protein [Bradyrhizobium sp. CB82]WFU43149.1 hypothetical protein QA640_12270 [Bradyrhizobium sp. CB82]
MKNLTRPAQKSVHKPVQNTGAMIEGRDFSLGKATPHLADAIDAQIDRDDASDDLIKEELHSNIRSSSPDWTIRPYSSSIGRPGADMHERYLVCSVAGFGVGSKIDQGAGGASCQLRDTSGNTHD